ncbi:GNAT superfamily N-acetyltransferase [Massilia sp. UYP11]|uniref:GNAT family N-acetyltransferase n=1 Tax=Massilia sp. UYP11 TaxID=1756385 RepID=UPI003D19C7C1
MRAFDRPAMPIPTSMRIRPLLPADLDAVLRVQAACYPPAMQEAAAVVKARLDAAAATCLAACDAGGVCGYLFAYPSRLGRVTALGAPFEIAPDADTLYLHDLAVDPRAHGRGLARALVAHLLGRGRRLDSSRGLTHAALVSVQDSTRFWSGLGFKERSTGDAGLLTYPAGAVHMARPLT